MELMFDSAEPQPEEISSENAFVSYIGAKIIKAKPMTKDTFTREIKGQTPNENEEDADGYLVEYPDNYLSWSPQWVFEQVYRPISYAEKKLI